MRRGITIGITAALVTTLAAGYIVADAQGIVPGFLTVEPPYPQASEFPKPPSIDDVPPVPQFTGALPATATEPSPVQIQELLNAFAADPRLSGARTGAVVSDVQAAAILGGLSPNVPIAPASTQKLLTAVAALSVLGDDATLDTTAFLQDTTVVLKGGGDMMLTPGPGIPAAINGRAGLGDLADQVAGALSATGHTTVSIAIDDTLFTGPTISPAWDPGDVPSGFSAPIVPIAIDVARLGGQGQPLPGKEYAPRSTDPALDAGKAFAQALQDRGITVSPSVSRTTAASSATELGVIHSAPLWQVIDYFLQFSDNAITEVVGRMVAMKSGLPGSFAGATQAVSQAVAGLGVDLTGAYLHDCSGLGRGSVLTAAQLDGVMQLLASGQHPILRSAAVGLPIAGLSGTLADRYSGSPREGLIRAKTGSLPGVRALAGTIVTSDQRLLAFSVVVDTIPPGSGFGVTAAIDDLVIDLGG